MGGKGRTGTVIACYMLYCGLFDSPAQALTYFAERRSKINKGVIQPSQLRYVDYFGKIIGSRKTPVVKDVQITKGQQKEEKTGVVVKNPFV
jgi:protein-tyrosine phosphatase